MTTGAPCTYFFTVNCSFVLRMMKKKAVRKVFSPFRTFLMWLVCCGSTQLKPKASSRGKRAKPRDSSEFIEETGEICKLEAEKAQTSSRTWNSPKTSENNMDSLSDNSSKEQVISPPNRHGNILSAGDLTSCIRSCSPSDVLLETDTQMPCGPVFYNHWGNTLGYMMFEDHLLADLLLTDMTITSGDSALVNQFGPTGHGRLPVLKSLTERCAYPVHHHVSSVWPSFGTSYSPFPHDSLFTHLEQQPPPCPSLTQDNWSSIGGDVTSSITSSDSSSTSTSDPLTPGCEPWFPHQDLSHDEFAYLDGPDELLYFDLWDYGVDMHPEERHRAQWEVTDMYGHILYEGTMKTPGCEPWFPHQDLSHDDLAYLDGPDELLYFELWDYGMDIPPEERHRAKWEVTDMHGHTVYEGTMFTTSSQ